MRFAFADPPYLGCGHLYAKHPEAHVWDDPETHRALIGRLVADYPDGWVLCLHAPSLRVLLPMTPNATRVCAWVKPFASFKPNVNPAYTWEPVLALGGRSARDRGGREVATVRDHLAANITLQKGLTGAKPEAFCEWVIDLLGARAEDTFDDLFPGTGVFGRVWSRRSRDPSLFAAIREHA